MRLPWQAFLAGAHLLLLACPAFAQQHSGATMRLVLGGGYADGAYEYRGLSNPGFSEPVRMLEWDRWISGPTISAAVQPAWWLSRNLAVLGELGATLLRGSTGSVVGPVSTLQSAGFLDQPVLPTLVRAASGKAEVVTLGVDMHPFVQDDVFKQSICSAFADACSGCPGPPTSNRQK